MVPIESAKTFKEAITENQPAAITQYKFLTNKKEPREIKNFLTITAHTYLGLLSADLIRPIEGTKDVRQLKVITRKWHIALRDAKKSKRFASCNTKQILAALRDEHATQVAE